MLADIFNKLEGSAPSALPGREQLTPRHPNQLRAPVKALQGIQ